MRKLIGILGGTFDPVHYGHLKPAHEIFQRLHLDELRLIPCCRPVHREPPLATAEQRLHMLRLALNEFPEFLVDDREIRRGGPSYTFDTLTGLRQEFPQAALCLLLGVDALQGFTQWHRWRQILEMAHLLVSTRPGYVLKPGTETAEMITRFGLGSEAELYARPAGGILFVETGQHDISSTLIRERLCRHEPLTGLLPQALEHWLNENPVYEDTKMESICS